MDGYAVLYLLRLGVHAQTHIPTTYHTGPTGHAGYGPSTVWMVWAKAGFERAAVPPEHPRGAASHPDTIPRPRPIRLIYPHHACVRRKAGHKHAAMCAASWPLLDHKRVTDVMDPLLERGVVAIARNTYRTVPFRWRTSPSKLKGQKDAPRSLSVALLGEA